MRQSLPVADRLWRKVEKTDGCWLWNGATVRSGHGMIRVGDTGKLTHRISWELANGSIPDGLCVLHRCDVPTCVRPDHLWLGTQAENVADMMNKGRGGRTVSAGEQNGQAKLTTSQVAEIRATPKGYGTGRPLAERFGVSDATISLIRSGDRWPTRRERKAA